MKTWFLLIQVQENIFLKNVKVKWSTKPTRPIQKSVPNGTFHKNKDSSGKDWPSKLILLK